MLKFVNNDPNNFPRKRKQAPKACKTCRKRKKRCHHDDPEITENGEPETSNFHSSLLAQSSPARGGVPSRAIHPTSSMPQLSSSTPRSRLPTGDHPDHHESEVLNPRFIGDLNPEGIFLAATSPNATRGASSDNGVGVWLAKALTSKDLQSASDLQTPSQSSFFYKSTSLLPNALLPALEEEALSIFPPPANVAALTNFYFRKLHPILPLIDQNQFHNLSSSDPRRIILQQGICLAASKSFHSKEHLILPGSDSPLAYRTFGERLSAAMRLILELGIVTDKIIRIQVFGLVSHFIDGQDNADVASQLLARAMQHAISVGLHIQGYRQRDADNYGITLFCSLWALDRMNAAFGGRPVMMHDRDVGRDLTQCFQVQEPCFRLLLEVTLLLDKVIRLYRPSNWRETSEPELDFPSFEELVMKCTGSQIATHSLATIETFYHAVAMLSFRSKTWNSHQRSPPAYLRQCLASSRVSTTTSREVREQLILFPFVPYAFSLALSVSYREMRHSKVVMNRTRAKTQFQSNCNLLSELGEIFSSASTIAEMGKSTLKEMDRVFSVAAISEQRSQPFSRNVDSNINGTIVTEIIDNSLETHGSLSAIQDQEPTQPMPDFDPLRFDSMSDMDPFGMFDPTFDLNSLDNLLESNLDLSFPTQFQWPSS